MLSVHDCCYLRGAVHRALCIGRHVSESPHLSLVSELCVWRRSGTRASHVLGMCSDTEPHPSPVLLSRRATSKLPFALCILESLVACVSLDVLPAAVSCRDTLDRRPPAPPHMLCACLLLRRFSSQFLAFRERGDHHVRVNLGLRACGAPIDLRLVKPLWVSCTSSRQLTWILRPCQCD